MFCYDFSYSLALLRAKFCVHACMTPALSGRTKLLYFALAKWALGDSILCYFLVFPKK